MGSNFVFFVLIYKWLTDKIGSFGDALMGRTMAWVGLVALVLVTLWILIQGYRVVTGTLREPIMALVVSMARVALIVTVASTMAAFGTNLNTFLTTDLNQAINKMVANSDEPIQDSIDRNLAYTEIAMSAIDAVQLVPGDDQAVAQQQRDQTLAIIGTAGPPVMAAVMLLMYQFALALFIGLGPLFILCLIFEQTRELFRKWLFYGIGTLFSLALLNVVTAMVLQLSIGVAAGMWTAELLDKVFFQQNIEGINHQALEQGGIGLILTLLILTIPPMGALFFNGTMGNFMYFSAFRPEGQPGPRGQPPGAYRYLPSLAAAPAVPAATDARIGNAPVPALRGAMAAPSLGMDVIKPSPQRSP